METNAAPARRPKRSAALRFTSALAALFGVLLAPSCKSRVELLSLFWSSPPRCCVANPNALDL